MQFHVYFCLIFCFNSVICTHNYYSEKLQSNLEYHEQSPIQTPMQLIIKPDSNELFNLNCIILFKGPHVKFAGELYYYNGTYHVNYILPVEGYYTIHFIINYNFFANTTKAILTNFLLGKPLLNSLKLSLCGSNTFKASKRGYFDFKTNLWQPYECQVKVIPRSEACKIFYRRKIKNIVIMGDSMSRHVFNALLEILLGNTVGDNSTFSLLQHNLPQELVEKCKGKLVYSNEQLCHKYTIGQAKVCNGNISMALLKL